MDFKNTENRTDRERVPVEEAKVTGAIFIAPTSVPLPEDATTPLDPAYRCLGFSSDDGITISEDASTNDIRAFEGKAKVRTVRNEYNEQVSFKPIECNADVAKFTWGDKKVSVDDDGNLTIRHHGGNVDPVNLVVETIPFEGCVNRRCATVQLAERGDVAINGNDPSGRDVTLDCLADKDGNTMVEHIAIIADDVEEGDQEEGGVEEQSAPPEDEQGGWQQPGYDDGGEQ